MCFEADHECIYLGYVWHWHKSLYYLLLYTRSKFVPLFFLSFLWWIICDNTLQIRWKFISNYNRFLLLINFRVLKNKQFEEKLNTTEHSVKDTGNQCSSTTTESSSTAVVVALAILLGISVSALLITCVLIYCKGLGRCKQLTYGR